MDIEFLTQMYIGKLHTGHGCRDFGSECHLRVRDRIIITSEKIRNVAFY